MKLVIPTVTQDIIKHQKQSIFGKNSIGYESNNIGLFGKSQSNK